MSFETFRVELRGGASSFAQVDGLIRQLPHTIADVEPIASGDSSYYTVKDGNHTIEVEVAPSPVRVSCRFTLSHPPSVDAALLSLVRELTVRLGMDAFVCDDVSTHDSQGFSIARFAEFAEIVSRTIAARRAEWIANFGSEYYSVTAPELYEKVILPRCVAVG